MTTPLVIQAEELDAEPAAWLAERCELVACRADDPGFGALLARADGLIVRTYTQVDQALLDAAPRLWGVARAGGGLAGEWMRGGGPPEGARFADQSNPIYRRRLNDRIYDVIEGLEPIAASKGITLSQLALGWVMRQPGVTAPIIGPRTMEQFEDNMKAVEVTFEEDELRQMNRVIRRGESVAPFYEADFGPHQFRF